MRHLFMTRLAAAITATLVIAVVLFAAAQT